MSKIKDLILKNISNIPGWRTKRKILVIESDDWGSVRSFSKEAVDKMEIYGLPIRKYTHFNAYDSLESNEDLELLFELLSSFKDCLGNSVKFTPLCIMGNPDFESIAKSDYQEYYFQPLEETIKEYPKHSRLIELWQKGREQNIFHPELHGREHVNINRYMQILKSNPEKEGLRFALNNKSVGINSYKNIKYPNYLGALHPITQEETYKLHQYIRDAAKLYMQYMGDKPSYFVAPNAEEPKELEKTLSEVGVKYLNRSKRRTYPVGDGSFKSEWNFMGRKTEFGQIILNRNCIFEPAKSRGLNLKKDWVDACLKDIELAFRYNKPAVVSTHRVNYVGFIDSGNRDFGLKSLSDLLRRSLQKWPDIEFMTSAQLGDLIRSEKEGATV